MPGNASTHAAITCLGVMHKFHGCEYSMRKCINYNE